MDAGFVAQSVRTARQTGLQWEQPDEAGPFSCARRARPSDAVRFAPAWNTSSFRVRAACRRTVQRRKGGGYGGRLNSYFFFFYYYFFLFLSVSLNSDHDWWTVNRGCVHGDLQPSFPRARQALRARGKPSTPTLPSYCQIICEKTCEILWLWEAESNKPLGKVSKSFDSFALEGVIPAGCQLEEKKHRDDEFNANTLHEWLSCHIQTKVILILTLITCLQRHL